MRILIATPVLPWPLNSGGNAAQFSTLKCLAEDHQFTLVCPVYDEAGMANAKVLLAELPNVNVRAVFCGTPPPPKPKLRIRMARSIVRCGRRLLAPPEPQTALQPDSAGSLRYPFSPVSENLIAALQDELSKGVDLCQAEFAEMLSLGSWFPVNLPKLFIHHQIHFVYAKRFLDTLGRNGYSSYLEAMMRTQELSYLQHYQGVITFSDSDRQALLPYLAPEKLFVSPFPIPADVGIADEVPLKFDGRFLFVAYEEHGPNRDALEWLLATIWPDIYRQMPGVKLVVVGTWSESAKSKLAVPGISFSGYVRNLRATLQGGIMLVPLRIGSGVRVKIIVAMAQGVPVVSTSIGCEGMPVRNGKDLLVRDDPGAFASAAVQLAQTPELWRQLAQAAQKTVSKHYSPEGVRRRRNEIYATIVQNARSGSA